MTKEEVDNRLNELIQNELFLDKIANSPSLEDTQAILKDEGVEMTIDELCEAMESGKTLLEENGYLDSNGELTEKALEAVAGGGWKRKVAGALICALGVVSGHAGVAVFGAVIVLCG